MRPDEHKKKKNAAYKKKHGMQTNKKADNTTSRKDRVERVSDDCQPTENTSEVKWTNYVSHILYRSTYLLLR